MAGATGRESSLADLDAQLREIADAHEIHRVSAEWLGRRLAVDRCLYALMNDDDESIDVIGNYLDELPPLLGVLRLKDFGPAMLGMLRSGQSWIVDDSETDPRIPETARPAYRERHARAVICLPLIRGQRLVALMAVQTQVARRWLPEEEELVRAVGNRCWESIERIRAEARAIARDDRLRALVEDSSQILWTADASGVIHEDSPSWRAFTGQTYTQFRGNGWASAIHPDDLPKTMAAVVVALQNPRPIDIEFRLRHADGSWRWIAEQIRPVITAAGVLREWVGVGTEITSRKEIELVQRFLVELDDAVRPLVDPEAIAGEAVRRLCEFLDADRSAYLEVTPDQKSATALRDHAPRAPSLAGGVYRIEDYGARFTQDMRNGTPHQVDDVTQAGLSAVERAAYAAAGTMAMINIPLQKDGRCVGIVGVYQTAPRRWTLREREVVLAVSNRCWESIERARVTRELQLANERKDQFIATLAHELRNPLSPLQNALQIARNPNATMPPGRLFDLMDRQIQQLVRLVDDLLDLSRISRGTIGLQFQNLDLDRVLNVALETARPALDAADHELDISPCATPICVRGDDVRLTQIFANLLSNAVKYTPERGRIQVRVTRDECSASVSVIDNGIGIPASMQDRVFDMFTQVSQSRGRLQSGLGIGLALVKNLVSLHGGTVRVSSDGPGTGSTFTVTLPLATAVHSAVQDDGAVPDCSGMRIVVVDDNRDSGDSTGLLLRSLGADVRIAYSGADALKVLGDFRPGLALLDIGMPGMDGYTLAEEVRRRPNLTTIRLAALTGWGQDKDRQRAYEAGFDHHLTKPLDMKALGNVVAAVHAGRRTDG